MATLITVSIGSGTNAIITWTNVGLSSNALCGIHLGEILQEANIDLISSMYSEIQHFPLWRHVNILIIDIIGIMRRAVCLNYRPWSGQQFVDSMYQYKKYGHHYVLWPSKHTFIRFMTLVNSLTIWTIRKHEFCDWNPIFYLWTLPG